MTSDGRLLPEDLLYELGNGVTPEWVEDARWHLPHHVRVRDGSWFILLEDLPAWEWAWERARSSRVAA